MNQESAATQHPAEDAALEDKATATEIEGETENETPFVVCDRPGGVDGPDGPDGVEAADDSAAPKPPTQMQVLEQQLADKDQRLQATLVQYKDALADFEAAKGRLRRDIGKEIQAGKRAILADLLDVMDNLERAVEAGQVAGESSALMSGVTMVRDQFLLKLQGFGVKRQDGLGQPFDPARFEAVSMVPVADAAQDGCVVGVIRTCYTMGDETLRYGMVAVGKAEAKTE